MRPNDMDDYTSPETAPVWAWTFLFMIVAGISASVWGGIKLAQWLH